MLMNSTKALHIIYNGNALLGHQTQYQMLDLILYHICALLHHDLCSRLKAEEYAQASKRVPTLASLESLVDMLLGMDYPIHKLQRIHLLFRIKPQRNLVMWVFEIPGINHKMSLLEIVTAIVNANQSFSLLKVKLKLSCVSFCLTTFQNPLHMSRNNIYWPLKKDQYNKFQQFPPPSNFFLFFMHICVYVRWYVCFWR